MQSRITLICLALLVAAVGCSASAGLLERDWQSPGDAALTYDTATGLEWLDITVTANRSWRDVVPGS